MDLQRRKFMAGLGAAAAAAPFVVSCSQDRHAEDGHAAPILAKTVVVAIDMQHVFADEGSPWRAPEFARAEHGVRQLVEKYGAANSLFTKFIAPATPIGQWVSYYKDWPFALKPAADPIWNIVPSLAPLVVNPTLDAPTFGKWNADMAARLPKVERILLSGVSTDCCVLSTALSALDTGIEVVVVGDACAAGSATDQRRALDTLGAYKPLARVTTLAELGI